MGQQPTSFSPRANEGNADSSASAPDATSLDQNKAASVELVTFAPTLVVEGHVPRIKIDAAVLRQRTIRRWIAVLGVLAFLCVGLFQGPGLYRSFRTWRATVLALQSEELVRKNEVPEAILPIRAAFRLSPNAPEVVRAMAMILSALNSPDAITYWNWVLESKIATDDDRRTAADCAMQNGLFNEADDIIHDLVIRDGADARNQLLAARWSALRANPAQAIFYATRAVNDDPTNKSALLFLALQELNNKYLEQDGVDSLFQLAKSDDDFGLTALKDISLDPNLKLAQIDRLIAILQTHPLAGEFERIATLALEIKRHPDQRDTLLDQAMGEHKDATPENLAMFAEWLDDHGEARRVLKFIPREQALSNRNIFAAYIDALGVLKRWPEIKSLLTSTTVPLEAPFVELYLSRCYSEMGDDQASDLHWQNAVYAAAYNPTTSLFLAGYAERHGQNERAAAVYRILSQEPVVARVAYQGLVRVLSDKDTGTLRDLLEQMVTRWPNDDEMETQYVYLNLLLNERVPDMQRRAARVFDHDSYTLTHRTNVAFVCLRLSDPAGAIKAYSQVSIDWKTAHLPDLVIYAATLNANGRSQEARDILAQINRQVLRPELCDLIKSIP